MFVGTKNGMFLSKDSGAAWKEINNGIGELVNGTFLPFNIISWLAAINDTLYLQAYTVVNTGSPVICYKYVEYTGIFLSTDNGISWQSSTRVSFPNTQITWNSLDPTIQVNTGLQNGNATIYGTTEGIYLSQDNGATWTPSNTGMACADLSLMAFNAGKIIVCSRRNTFIVRGDGSAWNQKNENLPNTGVNCLASAGNVMYAGTDSGVYMLGDTGTFWKPINSLSRNSRIFTLFSYGNKLFATGGTGYYQGDSFFISNTTMQSWSTAKIDSLYNGPASFVVRNNIVYAFCGNDCYLSSDVGITWTKAPFNARAFVSVVNCNNNIFGLTPYSFFISSDCPGAIPSAIYRLKPADTSWIQNDSLTDKTIQNLASLNGNLFAATGDGVYLAPDSGRPWKDISDGLGDRNVRALAFSDKEIFAATEAGLWHRPLSELPVGTIQKVRAPFNPIEVGMINTKNIKYSLPHESFVSLRIYDLAGRLVCSLVNKKQAAGSYSVILPVGNLRSGNYLYSFTAGEYQVQNKFIILR